MTVDTSASSFSFSELAKLLEGSSPGRFDDPFWNGSGLVKAISAVGPAEARDKVFEEGEASGSVACCDVLMLENELLDVMYRSQTFVHNSVFVYASW